MSVVYLVRTRVHADHEAEWVRWQEQEHIKQLLELPGYLGVQRFAEMGRPGSYLNVWRLATRSAFGSDAYRQASLTPWFERLRPFYDVEVAFSVEADSASTHDVEPWREQVVALAVERAAGGSGATAAAQRSLGEAHRRSLAAADGVAHVIRLEPLPERHDPASRSAPSDVLLTYLTRLPRDHHRDLPAAPPRVERRLYAAISPYLAAG